MLRIRFGEATGVFVASTWFMEPLPAFPEGYGRGEPGEVPATAGASARPCVGKRSFISDRTGLYRSAFDERIAHGQQSSANDLSRVSRPPVPPRPIVSPAPVPPRA